jgi:acylphosphatase
MLQTLSIIVTGKVQGVYYRQSTREKALELGLTGFVKNQPDGNVFIQASGTADQLNKLVAWCKQGPSRAQVTAVQVEHIDPRAFIGFTVER